MIYPDTIIASAAFLFFIITNILVFLLIAKNISKLSLSFYVLYSVNFALWAAHGYQIHDIALLCSSAFGLLISVCLLAAKLYFRIKTK